MFCSLQHSLAVLMEKMFAAGPHFVRCIKPNRSKQPDQLDSKLVMDQVGVTAESFHNHQVSTGLGPVYGPFYFPQWSQMHFCCTKTWKPFSAVMMELNPNPSNDRGATGFVCQYGLNSVLSACLVGSDFNTDYKLCIM